jgi:hypothetical protein
MADPDLRALLGSWTIHLRAERKAPAKDAIRLVLIIREVDSQVIDLPPVGQDNPGDSLLATFDASNPAGRLVGHAQARFTAMFRQGVFLEVTIIVRGRGQIIAEGVFRDGEQRSVVAVVGGTGQFRNARGQMFILRGRPPSSCSPYCGSPRSTPKPARGDPLGRHAPWCRLIRSCRPAQLSPDDFLGDQPRLS